MWARGAKDLDDNDKYLIDHMSYYILIVFLMPESNTYVMFI